jgi:pentatricopeptide repeat protein
MIVCIFFSVNAYARNGMGSDAVALYRQMPVKMRDEVSHVCVLNACSHSGLVDEAQNIFNEIDIKSERVISTMVS